MSSAFSAYIIPLLQGSSKRDSKLKQKFQTEQVMLMEKGGSVTGSENLHILPSSPQRGLESSALSKCLLMSDFFS